MSLLGNLSVGILGNMSGLTGSLKQSQSEVQKFAKNVDQMGKSISNVGKSMSLLVTGPLVAIGGTLLKVGTDFDSALNTIRVGTGATGEDLTALGDDFKAVFGAVPTDMQSASTAIADLNTRLGLTGEPLQALSTQMLNLVKVTKEDLGSTIASSTRVFGDWGVEVENQSDVLDYLFRTSQSTGIGINSLSSQLVQFGAPLRQMGFDLDTSAALLGKFEKEGVNAELVMGSLRIALGKMAKDGVEDASEALQLLITDIKGAGSTGEANAKAIGLFGARAGPDMAAAIREGRFEIEELVTALQNSDESINKAAEDTETLGERFTRLKNQVYLAVEPLANMLVAAIENLMPLFERLVGWMQTLVAWFTNLPSGVQVAIGVIAGLAAAIGPVLVVVGTLISSFAKLIPILGALTGPVGLIIAAVAALVAGLVYLYNTNETVRDALNAAWEWIKSAAEAIFGAIKEFWATWGDEIISFFKASWDTLVTVFETVFGLIRDAIVFIFDGIKAFWDKWGDTIVQAFKDSLEILKIVFSTVFKLIFETVKVIFNSLKAFWDRWGETITIVFKTVFNVVKTIVTGVFNAIKITIETVIGVVSGIIKAFLAVLKGDWKGAWNAVKGVAESIWDGIKRMFGNVGSTMLQVGKDIIQGLINGIKSMATAVANAAKDVAKGIGDGVKGFFGIASPSRLMAKYGRNIGEGLAMGMESQANLVSQAADDLAQAADMELSNPVFRDIGSPQAPSTPSPLARTIQSLERSGQEGQNPIIVQLIADGRQLAETIVTPLEQITQRRSRGLGLT